MGVRVRDLLMAQLDDLRYEPIDKRIRARIGDRVAVDSERALLAWEPKRVVPSYAVPEEDIHAELTPAAEAGSASDLPDGPRFGERRVYDPSIPFAYHTADGERLDLALGDERLRDAGFRPADPALEGYVILDFGAFDAWFEEDERNVSHPRDPFHRIDIVHSSRHVRVERDGSVLAESRSPLLLFEPPIPVRYYLPAADVNKELFRPSATRTYCAYKGEAFYWSLNDEQDIAWTYPDPLREASEVADRIAFFNERLDLVVDGRRLERPVTPWSRG
jgi:uncharacterized protein (DUF427 family)